MKDDLGLRIQRSEVLILRLQGQEHRADSARYLGLKNSPQYRLVRPRTRSDASGRDQALKTMRSIQTLSPFIMFLRKLAVIFGLKALTMASEEEHSSA